MKKLMIATMLLFVLFPAARVATATVLDFELGVVDAELLNDVNASYGGFTWDANMGILSNTSFNNGWNNTGSFPSGVNAAFNGFGVVDVSVNGGPIVLNGAYFRPWSYNDQFWGESSETVSIEGYYQGNLVGTASMVLLPGQFLFLSTNFGQQIDSFKISSDGDRRFWLMDDLTYNAAVPEPSTMLLLGSGLLGLVAYGRRRMRK